MSDRQILTGDDDWFKELQIKWRNNSLTDDEKDLYIKHLTLRHIDRKRSSRELQAENERLKEQYESTPERGLKALNTELEEYLEEYGRHESDTGAYVFDSDCCESYANGLERAIEILTAEDIG